MARGTARRFLTSSGSSGPGSSPSRAERPTASPAAARAPSRSAPSRCSGAIAPTDDPDSVAELGTQVRSGIKLARRAPWLLRLALQPMARGARRIRRRSRARWRPTCRPPTPPCAGPAHVEDPRRRDRGDPRPAPERSRARSACSPGPGASTSATSGFPAAFWSGECDDVHPTSQSQRLAAELDDPPIHVVKGAANFGSLPDLPRCAPIRLDGKMTSVRLRADPRGPGAAGRIDCRSIAPHPVRMPLRRATEGDKHAEDPGPPRCR